MNLSFYETLSFLLLFHPSLFLNYIFHEFKVLKKVITTETFNADFQNNFFQYFFILSGLFPDLLLYIYILYILYIGVIGRKDHDRRVLVS